MAPREIERHCRGAHVGVAVEVDTSKVEVFGHCLGIVSAPGLCYKVGGGCGTNGLCLVHCAHWKHYVEAQQLRGIAAKKRYGAAGTERYCFRA